MRWRGSAYLQCVSLLSFLKTISPRAQTVLYTPCRVLVRTVREWQFSPHIVRCLPSSASPDDSLIGSSVGVSMRRVGPDCAMMRFPVPDHLYEHVAVEVGGILGVEASTLLRHESASFEEAFSLRVWNGHCQVEVLHSSQ